MLRYPEPSRAEPDAHDATVTLR